MTGYDWLHLNFKSSTQAIRFNVIICICLDANAIKLLSQRWYFIILQSKASTTGSLRIFKRFLSIVTLHILNSGTEMYYNKLKKETISLPEHLRSWYGEPKVFDWTFALESATVMYSVCFHHFLKLQPPFSSNNFFHQRMCIWINASCHHLTWFSPTSVLLSGRHSIAVLLSVKNSKTV